MSNLHIVPSGDACLSVIFEERADPQVNARCAALARALRERRLRGVREVVPGFHTVAVYCDPLQISLDELSDELQRTAIEPDAVAGESRVIEVPVAYGGASGPDIDAVAAFAGISCAEVVRAHTAPLYLAYMLGFLPGFAYLGTVDPRIAMPRLPTPRARVAAGSVGIAGAQTGIYPCETPGGWRIIGRTALTLFDARLPDPALLRAGDRVRFTAV